MKIKLKIAYHGLEKENSFHETFLEAILKSFKELRHPSLDPEIIELSHQAFRRNIPSTGSPLEEGSFGKLNGEVNEKID